MTTPLLFLSGAGLPAWIWDDVRDALPADLPTSVAAYPSSGTLREYAAKVLAEAPEEFVVVAHSLGGVIGGELTSLAPERVQGFLGISAFVPRAGQSFVGSLPFPNRLILSVMMRLAGTRPPEKVIRSGLANGLDAEVADRIVKEFKPESQQVYRDPVGDTRFPPLRGYIQTTDDKELPLSLQQTFTTNLDPTWTHTLPTGHLPMLSHPADLAAAITTFLQ